MIISGIGFARCHSDHSVFVRRTKSGSMILIVFVDILLIGSDFVALEEAKEYFKRHFVTKDMVKLKYFIAIKVAYQKHGLLLSQKKYALDLIEKTDL